MEEGISILAENVLSDWKPFYRSSENINYGEAARFLFELDLTQSTQIKEIMKRLKDIYDQRIIA